jgi:type IV pilus assembly protein PilN
MIQINLLPWREQARKEQQKRFAIIVACVAFFGLFFTSFFHIYFSTEINNQIRRNAILQEALDKESADMMELTKKKQDLMGVDNQLHFFFTLREASYHAVRLLNELALRNPDSVTLYKIIRKGNTILIFGKAKSNLQVTLFLESMDKSKFFFQPVLTEIVGKENDAGEERNFQLRLVQQE